MNFILLHDMNGRPFVLNMESIIGFRPSADGSHVVVAIKEDDQPREFRETFEKFSESVRAVAASFIVIKS